MKTPAYKPPPHAVIVPADPETRLLVVEEGSGLPVKLSHTEPVISWLHVPIDGDIEIVPVTPMGPQWGMANEPHGRVVECRGSSRLFVPGSCLYESIGDWFAELTAAGGA